MRRLIFGCLGLTLMALPGCDDSAGEGGDALTDTAVDSTTGLDTRPVPDTRVLDTTPRDTGAGDTVATDTAPADTTATDTVSEDTSSQDTVSEDTATTDSAVADTASEDTVADTAVADSAAGDTAVGDTWTPPAGDNIFANGSFEVWHDGLPEGWHGDESSISADNVVEDATTSHDGLRSAQLVNSGSGHKRFTSAPMDLEAGRYACEYWVRGGGEIRNARYDGDFSSYSSYTTVASDDWTPRTYSFNQAEAVSGVFELIFSVRNTGAAQGHIRLDDVHCAREAEPCDGITCDAWQVCDNESAACVTAPGYCDDNGTDGGCREWESCGADHRCALAAGRCDGTIDCDGATPVCELSTHTCVAGDPCEGVTCEAWQVCRPDDARCVLAEGRCLTVADCVQALPTCDIATHSCVAVDGAANVVPNGGFEDWDDYTLGGSTAFRLPTSWYGVCDGCSPYFPETEIDPANVREYTTSTHSGATALQLVEPSQPADRFTTEPFPVSTTATYSCAYWVRGHGTHRHRVYCGAWGTDTSWLSVDSDGWEQVTFEFGSNVSACVLILYASHTNADRDHLQFDDVVCAPK